MFFFFTDPYKNAREEKIKHQNLLELVDFIISGSYRPNETLMEEISKMFFSNLFRTLTSRSTPAPPSIKGLDPEEEVTTLEPAWSHL